MTVNFIKKIKEKIVDERVHKKFTRYGIGEFEKESIFISLTASNIKIQSGFEYNDVFYEFIADYVNEDVNVKGVIITFDDIQAELSKFVNILEIKKVPRTKTNKYVIEGSINAERFKEFVEKFSKYFILLNLESKSCKVKTKDTLPKVGELKEKFTTFEIPISFIDRVKDEFLFDVNVDKFKKAEIRHKYIIEDLIIPEGYENNPELARIKAKRKGKIIRKINIDGKEFQNEISFEV